MKTIRGRTFRTISMALSSVRPVVQDEDVAGLQAMVFAIEHGGGLGGLALANPADLLAAVLHGPAVAGRRRGDVNLPAPLTEQGECAGAHELRVVRMGAETQRDFVTCQHAYLPLRITKL